MLNLEIGPPPEKADYSESIHAVINRKEFGVTTKRFLEIPCEFNLQKDQKFRVDVIRAFKNKTETIKVAKISVKSLITQKVCYFGYKSTRDFSYRYLKATILLNQEKPTHAKDLTEESLKQMPSELTTVQTQPDESAVEIRESQLFIQNSSADTASTHLLDFSLMVYQTSLNLLWFQEYSLYADRIESDGHIQYDINGRFSNDTEVCRLPNGDLLLVGGSSMDNVLRYRHVMIAYTKMKKCQLLAILPEPRKAHTVKYINGLIFIFGGRNLIENIGGKAVLCYDPAKALWISRPELLVSFEVNGKDNMEIFWNEEVIVVCLRKAFQLNYLRLSENIWKKLKPENGLGNFSDMRVLKTTNTHAFLLFQPDLNETTMTFAKFDFQLLKFENITVINSHKLCFKNSFIINDHLLVFSHDQIADFNIPNLLEQNPCKKPYVIIKKPINEDLLMEITTNLRTKPSKMYSTHYEYSSINSLNLFKVSEKNIEIVMFGESFDKLVISSVYWKFSFYNRKDRRTIDLDLPNCKFCPLNDGSLFIFQIATKNNKFDNECFIQTLDGCIPIEGYGKQVTDVEILNYKQFVFCISHNASNKIEYFDLQTGKWHRLLKLNYNPIHFRLYADHETLFILEFTEKIIIRTCVDLITKSKRSRDQHPVVFENISHYSQVQIVPIKKDEVLFVYPKSNKTSSFFQFNFANNIQTAEIEAFNGQVHFTVIVADDLLMFCSNDASKKCNIKTIDVQLLVKCLLNGESPEVLELQTMVPSLGASNLAYLPLFNYKSTIPQLNYFKYSNFRDIQDIHEPKYLILKDGLNEYSLETQTLKLRKAFDMRDFPKLCSVVDIKNGTSLIIGGITQTKNRLTISSEVQCLNILTKTKRQHSNLSNARFCHSSILFFREAYVIGGYQSYTRREVLSSVEKFNVRSGKWIDCPHLNIPRAEFDVVFIFSAIYVFFGNTVSGLTNSIEYFDNNEGKWFELEGVKKTNLPKLKAHRVLQLTYNSVVVLGGEGENSAPNFNFFIIKWDKGFKSSPEMVILENKIQKSIQRPLAYLSRKDIVLFTDDKVVIYKHSPDLSWTYSVWEVGRRKVDSPRLLINYSLDQSESSNEQFQSRWFDSLYLLGVEQHPQIYKLNPQAFAWEIITPPKNFVFLDYSCCISLSNGQIFVCGGIDAKATEQIKSVFLLTKENNELKCKVLPPMINSRYTFVGVQINEYVYIMGGRQPSTVY